MNHLLRLILFLPLISLGQVDHEITIKGGSGRLTSSSPLDIIGRELKPFDSNSSITIGLEYQILFGKKLQYGPFLSAGLIKQTFLSPPGIDSLDYHEYLRLNLRVADLGLVLRWSPFKRLKLDGRLGLSHVYRYSSRLFTRQGNYQYNLSEYERYNRQYAYDANSSIWTVLIALSPSYQFYQGNTQNLALKAYLEYRPLINYWSAPDLRDFHLWNWSFGISYGF